MLDRNVMLAGRCRENRKRQIRELRLEQALRIIEDPGSIRRLSSFMRAHRSLQQCHFRRFVLQELLLFSASAIDYRRGLAVAGRGQQ